IGPDPRNFNQRVSLGRNDLLIRTFPNEVALLAGSTTQTLHFKALMEVVTGKTATAGQVEATANYILAYK
ncbi:hypothetical protein PO354_13510, partial [Enterobacter roggenkampii]